MNVIEQVYTIHAPVEKVWQALTDPACVVKWSGAPAEMSDVEGASFSLWGGDVHGTNTTVLPNQLLVQEWYGGKWQQPSNVSFGMWSDGKQTTLRLVHAQIPEEDRDDIERGWREYYVGPLIRYVEGTVPVSNLSFK